MILLSISFSLTLHPLKTPKEYLSAIYAPFPPVNSSHHPASDTPPHLNTLPGDNTSQFFNILDPNTLLRDINHITARPTSLSTSLQPSPSIHPSQHLSRCLTTLVTPPEALALRGSHTISSPNGIQSPTQSQFAGPPSFSTRAAAQAGAPQTCARRRWTPRSATSLIPSSTSWVRLHSMPYHLDKPAASGSDNENKTRNKRQQRASSVTSQHAMPARAFFPSLHFDNTQLL